MKTLIVSDELYEKLKEASERYKKDQLELPDLSTIGEFLTSFKLADNPCLDCVKKEYSKPLDRLLTEDELSAKFAEVKETFCDKVVIDDSEFKNSKDKNPNKNEKIYIRKMLTGLIRITTKTGFDFKKNVNDQVQVLSVDLARKTVCFSRIYSVLEEIYGLKDDEVKAQLIAPILEDVLGIKDFHIFFY